MPAAWGNQDHLFALSLALRSPIYCFSSFLLNSNALEPSQRWAAGESPTLADLQQAFSLKDKRHQWGNQVLRRKRGWRTQATIGVFSTWALQCFALKAWVQSPGHPCSSFYYHSSLALIRNTSLSNTTHWSWTYFLYSKHQISKDIIMYGDKSFYLIMNVCPLP